MSRRKKKKSIMPFIIFLLVLVIVLVTFLIIKNAPKKDNKTSTKHEKIDKIENYDYNLYKNNTSLYKKYFEELKEVLNKEEIDEEEYAKLIARLFVIDFYSLDTHITNQDVGGLDYVYSPIRDNFALKATDTIYKYVKSNVYGDRKQKLPVVKEITKTDIVSKRYTYTSTDKTIDINDNNAYFVAISWTYEDNSGKYQTSATITIIHEKDDLLSIVSVE